MIWRSRIVDLLLQRGDHPLHISRRLVRDLLNGTEARVVFCVLSTRDLGESLDAIPAVRERNIGQVSAENRFATGFLGQKLGDFGPVLHRLTRNSRTLGP